MFSWLRDKTTTSYNTIQDKDDQSWIVCQSRPETAVSMSHPNQRSNGINNFLFR